MYVVVDIITDVIFVVVVVVDNSAGTLFIVDKNCPIFEQSPKTSMNWVNPIFSIF